MAFFYLAPRVRLKVFLGLILFTILEAKTITGQSIKDLKVRPLDLHHVPLLVLPLHLDLGVLHGPEAVHQELVEVFALPGVVDVDPE